MLLKLFEKGGERSYFRSGPSVGSPARANIKYFTLNYFTLPLDKNLTGLFASSPLIHSALVQREILF